jgi:hypothetical protein
MRLLVVHVQVLYDTGTCMNELLLATQVGSGSPLRGAGGRRARRSTGPGRREAQFETSTLTWNDNYTSELMNVSGAP